LLGGCNVSEPLDVMRSASPAERDGDLNQAQAAAARAYIAAGKPHLAAAVYGFPDEPIAASAEYVGDGRDPPQEESSSQPDWVNVMRAWAPSTQALGWQRIEVEHAVQDLIRKGKVGALVAGGGTGKTTLLLTLFICHATGRPFLGLDVMVGSCVLISNDDPQEDLEEALERVMTAMELTASEVRMVRERVRLHSLQGSGGTKKFTCKVMGAVGSTGLQEFIVAGLEGVPDLVGIAIDTLRQFSGGSTNDEEVINLTIGGATEIARRTGAYVILPHHTGKQNYRDGVSDMYCGSGSAAIADNCRFVLLLQTAAWPDIESKIRRTGQEHGDPFVLISTRGSLLMKPCAPIFLYRDEYRIERIAGASLTRDQQEDDKDRAVLRAIRSGATSKNDVFRIVKGKKATVLDRIDDLIARGHITAGGSGSGSRGLAITATGARLLEPRP